jgi:hypothetical protein
MADDDVPGGTWWLLGATAVALLVAALLAIALISAGVFDPKPVGELVWSETAPPLTVAAGERQIQPLGMVATGDYSLRLLANLESGELDVGYGLVAGEAQRLFVAVAPTGYLAIWQEVDGHAPEFLMPWQTWLHVRPERAANEIWLDVRGEQATVRINRELLWQGAAAPVGRQASLYLESFAGPATVHFQSLDYYANDGR